jgi:hypothetical protein
MNDKFTIILLKTNRNTTFKGYKWYPDIPTVVGIVRTPNATFELIKKSEIFL